MFRRRRSSQDFQAEMDAHLQLEADRLRAEGAAPEAAGREAARAFGNMTRAAERFYESTHVVWWDNLLRDGRVCVRMLRKSWSFTLAAILTLAVAIGANLVAFGGLNAVLLRPINVPDASTLYAPQPHRGDTSLEMSYPDYVDFRSQQHSFAGLAAFSIWDAALENGRSTSMAWVYEVSGNYFDVLELHPYLGRFFHRAAERGDNSVPAVVLSYAYWKSRFGGDGGLIGRTVEVDQHPFVVVGVAPPAFHGTLAFFAPAFYVPMVDEPEIQGTNLLHARTNSWVFMTLGHLRPGVSPAQAVADLNAIGAGLARRYPRTDAACSFSLQSPALYGGFIGNPARAFMAALMLLAGLILLAACANLGSLFAARATDRSRELALRLALGASRFRVLRLFVLEGLLLALAGGALGLGGGWVLLRSLSRWQPLPDLPIHLPIAPDARVCLAALGLAVLCGLLTGLAALRQVMRTDPYQTIKAGRAAGRQRRFTLRDLLLGLQIAICAVLLTAALVAVRGLGRLQHAAIGFQPQQATLLYVNLSMAGFQPAAVPAFQKRMLAAVAALPGVRASGAADWVPLGMQGFKDEHVYDAATTDLRPRNAAADAVLLKISPGYLRAAGTPLLAGRDFTWADGPASPPVAIVNQEFQREVFHGQTPVLGRYFKTPDGVRVRVAGVVADGKYNSLTERQQPALFLPLRQSPSSEVEVVVRSRIQPLALARALRRRMRQLDPGVPVSIETWTAAMTGTLLPSRVAAVALGILGGLSALLALIGIFGLTAYTVSQHRREVGIRIALGARREHVLHATLDRILRLFGVAAAAGLVLGVLASGVLSALVYSASPRDPLVLAGVVLMLVALGAVAALIPARRALHTNPAEILREP